MPKVSRICNVCEKPIFKGQEKREQVVTPQGKVTIIMPTHPACKVTK